MRRPAIRARLVTAALGHQSGEGGMMVVVMVTVMMVVVMVTVMIEGDGCGEREGHD